MAKHINRVGDSSGWIFEGLGQNLWTKNSNAPLVARFKHVVTQNGAILPGVQCEYPNERGYSAQDLKDMLDGNTWSPLPPAMLTKGIEAFNAAAALPSETSVISITERPRESALNDDVPVTITPREKSVPQLNFNRA